MALERILHSDPFRIKQRHLLKDVLGHRTCDTHLLKLTLEAVGDLGITV